MIEKRSAVSSCALIIALVFGLLGAPGSAAWAQDAVRIAVGVDPVFTPWWIAERKGFFKKYGIQAEITRFSGGPDLADAVLAGNADFGSSGTATWMPRLARGSLLILATMAKGVDNYKIAALTAIKSLDDLKGKKVGTVGGSSTDYLWDLVAKKLGTPPGGIELVAIPPPELVPSLDRGDIQAFFCWEPWPTKAVQVSGKDKVHLLAGSSDVGYYSNIILVGNEKFVTANPGATVRVLAAVRDATDYMNKDHATAVQVGAEENKLTPEVAGYITDLYRYSFGFADDMVEAAKSEEAWMRSRNQLKGAPIDWSKVADRKFVDQVKSQ
jgi:NitT/TauT family transport system substrate-binding protein